MGCMTIISRAAGTEERMFKGVTGIIALLLKLCSDVILEGLQFEISKTVILH